MKKIVFYASVPVIFVMAMVLAPVQFIVMVLSGIIAIIENIAMRWECWATDIKPGELINCPWKKSIIEVFGDTYSNVR